MTKFSELKYSEFLELINFLAEREKDLDKNEAIAFAVEQKLNRFIPNITAAEAMVFNSLILSILEGENAEETFNAIQKNYPSLEFDPNGKSTPKIRYSDLSMDSLTMVYNAAAKVLQENDWKDPTEDKQNIQIWNAFNLKCLKLTKPAKIYGCEKALYFKNNQKPVISKKELEEIEVQCEWLVGKDNDIPNRLLMYIKEKPTALCITFLRHFKKRLEIAYNDIDSEYEETKQFVDNLKKLG